MHEDDQQTKNFLIDTTNALNESIEKYRVQVKDLEDDLTPERIEELVEYWDFSMPQECEYEFLLRICYSEKLLLTLWTKIKRLTELRARAAHQHMLLYSVTSNPDKEDD